MTPRRLWVIVVVWAFLSTVLWATGAEPAIAVLAGIIAAVAVGSLTAVDLILVTSTVNWRKGQAAPQPDAGAVKLQRLMNAGVRYDSTDLQETLVTLIDDRLLAHNGNRSRSESRGRNGGAHTETPARRRRPKTGNHGSARVTTDTDRHRGAMTQPQQPTDLDVAATSRLAGVVLDEVEKAVVGKRDQLALMLCGILAGGHVLVEDLPGLGKTLAARSFAQALGLEFARAQFTPDLLPADLTGSFVFDQRETEFVFRPGPLFTGLLLADEINRTPPKTQAALLEAMQERQVTVEGQTFPLEAPFHVLATANPVEYEGTYPLPEAQLDRFLLRISFGYPTPAQEWEVLTRRMDRRAEAQELDTVVDAATLLGMQAAVETVSVDADVGRYCVDLAVATRAHGQVQLGASPRGTLALLLCGRTHAVIAGRDYVTPDDVKAVAPAVLAHRITVKPELWLTNASGTAVTQDVLSTVPTPKPGQHLGT